VCVVLHAELWASLVTIIIITISITIISIIMRGIGRRGGSVVGRSSGGTMRAVWGEDRDARYTVVGDVVVVESELSQRLVFLLTRSRLWVSLWLALTLSLSEHKHTLSTHTHRKHSEGSRGRGGGGDEEEGRWSMCLSP
jgi:hypothetical protein